ncbi:MAG: formylglycine-generating enzyme family protein [Anaerolineaceae bacterium]
MELEPTNVSTRISDIDGMEMVFVSAGDFLMGSQEGVGNADEHPQHTVYLDAFWIDKTEVTNNMYEKCVAAGACSEPKDKSSNTRNPYYGNPVYADFPVIYVDWNQAQAYCAWTGRTLPSEAQWEKAARGTDGRSYPWGNQEPDSNLANYNDNIGDPTEAGSYPAGASPYGALDMAGNVWEWTANWLDVYPGGDLQASEYFGTIYRTLRGAAWYLNADEIRSAFRAGFYQSGLSKDLGFRCVLNETH